MQRIAAAAWSAPDRVPLLLAAGDRVVLGERSDEWPAYLWCTGPDGTSGWVPDEVLDVEGTEGHAALPYSTAELTVPAGASVEAIRFMAEWWWCRDEGGNEGWLPDRVLEPLGGDR